MGFNVFGFVIVPFLIFVSRIMDVTIGTIRITFISKGFKEVAAILGFIEIIIWLVAMKEIMTNLDNIITYIAYGAGYAAGNYIGILIEEKISLGLVSVRIITENCVNNLVNALRSKNYGVTTTDAEGSEGKVKIIFTIISRNKLPEIANLINDYNPAAFYSVEEIKSVKEGIFPLRTKMPFNNLFNLLNEMKKEKKVLRATNK